ncbi:MAG TPA: adenylate/guanylate cyclase domain-containing protein, partial [Acidimicrobiales bacterium]|nr:adenylate/guanylate cyclase domain-containing protein [Acidimicrobiales bacterium]
GLAKSDVDSEYVAAAVLFLGAVAFGAGLLASVLAARAIADPVTSVREGLERIERGELEARVPVDDGSEVGQLQAGFNRMVHGLRERQRLQELFGRHVGHEVAALALERDADLGGESRPASVMFVDLVGSTAMAEVLPPGEVVATLNAFFDAVVDVVTSEGGWVNKFHGDGALAVFGVPGHEPDHQERALRAARRLCTCLAELADEHPGLDAGIGVSSGTVVAGNVGSEERYEYTVIGRAVNQAARLTELAKDRPGRVLASGAAVQGAGSEKANWTSRGRIGLRGQRSPTDVYEPATPPASARLWDAGHATDDV